MLIFTPHSFTFSQRRQCGSETGKPICKQFLNHLTYLIIHRELLDWRHDHWAKELFQDRARSHVLAMIGYGGRDAVLPQYIVPYHYVFDREKFIGLWDRLFVQWEKTKRRGGVHCLTQANGNT